MVTRATFRVSATLLHNWFIPVEQRKERKNGTRIFHPIRTHKVDAISVHDSEIEILSNGDVTSIPTSDLDYHYHHIWKSNYETQIYQVDDYVQIFGWQNRKIRITGEKAKFKIGDFTITARKSDDQSEFEVQGYPDDYKIKYYTEQSELADFFDTDSKILEIGCDTVEDMS